MQLIKAYKTEATIKGLTKTVLISIEVDDDDFDGSYMEADFAAEIRRDLERGRLSNSWVKVTARFSGLEHFEGVESMGQVTWADEADLLSFVSEYDMAQIATANLVNEVLSGASKIGTFLKGA